MTESSSRAEREQGRRSHELAREQGRGAARAQVEPARVHPRLGDGRVGRRGRGVRAGHAAGIALQPHHRLRGRALHRRLHRVLLHDQQRDQRLPAGHLRRRLVARRLLLVLQRHPLLHGLQRSRAAVRTSATGSAPAARSARVAAAATRGGSTATTSATGSATRRSGSSVRSRAGSSRACRRTPSPSTRARTAARGRQLHRRARARARVHTAARHRRRRSPRCCRVRARVVSSAAGKLTAFGRLADGTMALQEFDGTNWSTSSIPFAICTSSIAATTSGSNTYAFVKSNNGGFWWNQRTNGGAWSSSWTSLGGNFISDPAMATDASGVSYAFGRGADDAVWFCRKPGTGFTLPQSLGGSIDSDPCGGERRHRPVRLRPRLRPGDLVPALRRWQPRSVDVARRHADRPTPRRAARRAGRSSSRRGTDNAVWVRYVLGPNGITTWQWIDGFATSDPDDLQRPGRHVRVRARHRQRASGSASYNGGTSWAPLTKLGALAASSPIAISDTAGGVGAVRRQRQGAPHVPLRQRLVGHRAVHPRWLRTGAGRRLSVRLRRLFIACAVAGSLAWSSALPASAVDTVSPGSPQGNVTPTLQPAKGVAVVAQSAPVDGRVALLLHNGTAKPGARRSGHRGGGPHRRRRCHPSARGQDVSAGRRARPARALVGQVPCEAVDARRHVHDEGPQHPGVDGAARRGSSRSVISCSRRPRPARWRRRCGPP